MRMVVDRTFQIVEMLDFFILLQIKSRKKICEQL
jgi:hypothetical protein